ncbi:unnamed protein product [Penicillium discolor]
MTSDHGTVELQQLRYVVAVADTGSFTRAAERCHVTQSALSHQVAALERELGVRLFARTSRSVRATESGEAFLRSARLAVRAADQAREDAAAAAGEVVGTLRLGIIPTVTAVDVPALLVAYRTAHPAARVELREGNSDGLMTAIRQGDLDVAFLGLREGVEPQGVASRPLSHEPLVAVRRDVAFESDTAASLIGLVAAGLAVTLLAPGVVRGYRDVVDTVAIQDGPVRVEHLAWDAVAPRSAARAFLDIVAAAS